ncbi:uncharacterized protein CLUP02_02665 [Colletotrichum lupini]|uniref:Uncharacterized protein n=1 Tax=Colletotrichum lupini TaxID=145971 RepID=A0A9Q8WB12_9PEZI|nr:uncharacterized protein CLUP02_02665 [Colletotrichum lupini]UQC77198.1 hypothetical protein CLUP02_02665 [Colletotrichum lupini]
MHLDNFLGALTYTFGGQTNPCYLVDANFWEEEARRAHVNTRALVFQKLLVSRRVVSFGERQVFWSCRSGRAAEIWPPDIPVKDPYEGPRIEDLQLDDNEARGKTKSTRKAYDCWCKIVVTYTSCKITFPSDRMIALSAIVKEMMKNRSSFEECLLCLLLLAHRLSPIGLPLIKVEDYQIEYVTDEKTGLTSVWNIVVNGLNPREEKRENHVKLDMFLDKFDEQNDNSILYCMPC